MARSPHHIDVPLPDRTFERRQGCWNCSHYSSTEKAVQHWKANCRPKNDARIADAKMAAASMTAPPDPQTMSRIRTDKNAPCPCGSNLRYSLCHWKVDKGGAELQRKLDMIENGVRILDDMERAIAEGHYALCLVPDSAHEFTQHSFLCDRWVAAEGYEKTMLDKLPEELYDIHGRE